MKKIITLAIILSAFNGMAQRTMFHAKNKYVAPVLPAAPVQPADPVLGATYGGGKIFYIFQPGDPGYVAGESHGLIAAVSDQTASQWGCWGASFGGLSDLLGAGDANTNVIIANCGQTNIAAKRTIAVSDGGYTDWYLPSKNELNKLYLNRSIVGGFLTDKYWSSSQASFWQSSHAYYQEFTNGGVDVYDKNSAIGVRAIRKF
jgi:hypothetical protein